ncbi:hypothetical protein [Microbacterium sp. Marseille-Q6965]|uniref:hypothetical protein n=1 Tax=Microbacterium sp. Marseille-Q6965 TaxID=2965072 RepID=UPI0021B75C06|nr:hypothetical protein [Microbacterium sp. Marseille-Q6965]
MANEKRPARMIPAKDVLEGRWTGDGYPFRYVVVWHSKELVARYRNQMMDTVLSAVEVLEGRGWELVSVDEAVSLACLRRITPGARPPLPQR